MPRAKEAKPADMRVTDSFYTESLLKYIERGEQRYIYMEPWPLTHELKWTSKQQSVFFDTCFGFQHGCDFARDMHKMYEKALFLEASTDLRSHLAERRHHAYQSLLTPTTTSVRIYGLGSMFDKRFARAVGAQPRPNMLLRMNIPSFYPLPASMPNMVDPLYTGKWVDPLTGEDPQDNCLWWREGMGAEETRVMERLRDWAESALQRTHQIRSLKTFLRAAVNYSGSTEMLFKNLPGLRQVVTLNEGEERVEAWTKSLRGAGFNALMMRHHFPLWTSEWSTVYRPLLISVMAARQSAPPSGLPTRIHIVSHIPA